ncbi:hypothetical protein [Agrobacterium sp.]|jgi:hypothetical protein
MTQKNVDPTSDAARSDPKAADQSREELKKKAEQQLRKTLDRPSRESDA